jgi:catalase
MDGIAPDEVVERFHRIFGCRQGYRPVHARGIVCTGSFAATSAAASLSSAGHLRGSPIEATARFPYASGDPHASDHHPSARGLAVKLALRRVWIASPGDDVDDPTAVWPRNRPVVDVGRLEITGLVRVPESTDRILAFDPTRVVDGIELSDDPILHFRAATYRASVASRVTSSAR